MHGMAVVFVQCRSARARVHMQVPLVDVTSDLGPLEINVAGGAGGRRAGGCAVVRGVARRGTALMYRHVQPHRGTAAAAAAAVPRVVLDISYMLPRSVESDNYLAREKYMAAAAAQMRVLRLRAAHLCASDGLCANSEEVGAIRTGEAYEGRPSQPTAEGWVGSYRGHGAGEGEWVDANGSVYVGQFLDGLCHGRGKYAAASAHTFAPERLRACTEHASVRLSLCAPLYSFADGAEYEGEFRDDLRHGWGRYTPANRAEVYEGEWRQQQRHGHATVLTAGLRFVGEVRGGQPVRGKLEYADGRVHDGDIKMGVVHGRCAGASGVCPRLRQRPIRPPGFPEGPARTC